MEVVVENLGDLKRKISISIPNEQVRDTYNKCYRSLQTQVNIKGFRKGKFPRSLLEKRFKEYMEQEAWKDLVPSYYEKALKQESLTPATEANFDLKEIHKEKPLNFTAVFEIKPDFSVPAYPSFTLEKQDIVTTAEELAKEKKETLESQVPFIKKEGSSEEGNQLILSYEGLIEGESIDGASATDQEYLLGSKQFLPEFEERIYDVKEGEDKAFDVTYPEDYHVETLQGKTAQFTLSVKEVQEKVVPEVLDEELLSKFGENIKSPEDLDRMVEENLQKKKELGIKQDYRKEVLEQLKEKLEFDIPEEVFKKEVKERMEKPPTPEESGLSEEERQTKLSGEATKDLRIFYLIEKIKEAEKIELNEEELQMQLTYQAYMMGVDPQRLFQSEFGQKIIEEGKFRMIQDNVLDFIVEKVLAA